MNNKTMAYKAFVDQVVATTSSVLAERVKSGEYPRVESNSALNEVLESLTQEQRNLMSQVVRSAQKSAVHDVLAMLEDEAEIYFQGELLPKSPFGTPMNFDYIARSEGDDWPDECG